MMPWKTAAVDDMAQLDTDNRQTELPDCPVQQGLETVRQPQAVQLKRQFPGPGHAEQQVVCRILYDFSGPRRHGLSFRPPQQHVTIDQYSHPAVGYAGKTVPLSLCRA